LFNPGVLLSYFQAYRIRGGPLTSIKILDNSLRDGKLVGNGNILSLLFTANDTKATIDVHSSLKGISFPTEDVIAVLTVVGEVSDTENEWLGTIRGSLGFIVKSCGVSDNLILHLNKC
jgi:hypothetical protein